MRLEREGLGSGLGLDGWNGWSLDGGATESQNARTPVSITGFTHRKIKALGGEVTQSDVVQPWGYRG